jgi:hypothetical protein
MMAGASLDAGKYVADFVCPDVIESQQLEFTHHPLRGCRFIARKAWYTDKIMSDSDCAFKRYISIHWFNPGLLSIASDCQPEKSAVPPASLFRKHPKGGLMLWQTTLKSRLQNRHDAPTA